MTSNRNSVSSVRADLASVSTELKSPLSQMTPRFFPALAGTTTEELRTRPFALDGARIHNSSLIIHNFHRDSSPFSAKSAVNPLQLVAGNCRSLQMIATGCSCSGSAVPDNHLTPSGLHRKFYFSDPSADTFSSTAPSSVATVRTFEHLPDPIHNSSLKIHNSLSCPLQLPKPRTSHSPLQKRPVFPPIPSFPDPRNLSRTRSFLCIGLLKFGHSLDFGIWSLRHSAPPPSGLPP
jgi:hypothetical protein